MEAEQITVKKYCRLCAKIKEEDKLMDLQQVVPNLMRLNQPFLAIQDSSLPQKVCLVCVRSLDQCVQFIDEAEKAHNALVNIFSNYDNDDDFIELSEELLCEEKFFAKVELITDKNELITDKTSSSASEFDGLEKKNLASSESKPSSSKRKTNINKHNSKSVEKSISKVTNRFDTSSDEEIETNEENSSHLGKVDSWDNLKWVCCTCDMSFPLRTHLVEHSMATHNCCTTYKCPSCSRRFLKLDTYILHVRNIHNKKLQMSCFICSQAFSSVKSRVRHEKTHVTEPNTCPGCIGTFASEELLAAHIASYYLARYIRKANKLNIDHVCYICNMKFDLKDKLRKHISSNHRPKQSNICDQCGMTFSHKSNLNNHMLIHNNIRNHKCQLCPASFRLAITLANHMLRHKGEKNHCCPECGKAFMLKSQLHTHLSIHSGKLPFRCEHCDRCFRLNPQLKRHMRQHTGYKPYRCQICEREFTDWPNYNKHSVRKHNIDLSKTKRTPQGVIRLANLPGTQTEDKSQ